MNRDARSERGPGFWIQDYNGPNVPTTQLVLDTNIVASATYWRGKPTHRLEAWVLGRFDLAISHPILTEFVEPTNESPQ